jgi:hypothetical protein
MDALFANFQAPNPGPITATAKQIQETEIEKMQQTDKIRTGKLSGSVSNIHDERENTSFVTSWSGVVLLRSIVATHGHVTTHLPNLPERRA